MNRSSGWYLMGKVLTTGESITYGDGTGENTARRGRLSVVGERGTA
jgi:hypothetical protein